MANHAPFKKHGTSSVRAHGKVSGVEVHPDGKHATVTVRHEAPKSKKPSQGGVFGMESGQDASQETRATMPAEHAKLFPAGSKVAVHIGPPSELPGDTDDETGQGEENESPSEAVGETAGEGEDDEEGEANIGAKGPKQASGKGAKKPTEKGGKKESPIAAAVKKSAKK